MKAFILHNELSSRRVNDLRAKGNVIDNKRMKKLRWKLRYMTFMEVILTSKG
jgi:hypothetical protein